MAEEKKTVGRPKESLDTLPPNWYNEILELYKEGGSDEEVKAALWVMRNKNNKGFSNDLFDRWLQEEEEFSETIRAGRLLAAGWWHRNGRKNLANREFNFQGWFMQMKNRFGWADKTETKTENVNLNSAPMSKEEIQDISKSLEEDF